MILMISQAFSLLRILKIALVRRKGLEMGFMVQASVFISKPHYMHAESSCMATGPSHGIENLKF